MLTGAQHRVVRKWSTIIREGAVGACFYLLLKGAVQVTSTTNQALRDRPLVLRDGASFGEGALVTLVRREATVMAIEPCHLVQLSAQACEGLNVSLTALQSQIVEHMLEKASAPHDRPRRAALSVGPRTPPPSSTLLSPRP
jgi:CRP-like cAMP-binding protein